ncbi:nucleolar protein 53 [Geosmithia morbida]|uniref:Ribosome biogenesis protein NOP53 n=1 Tax=Geosmithia morbida TaxID=1094350 RepID=A0A9P4Z163_9HYPO|nr:nucleolar protein 53 [Geosmithia morbida]KAF4125383.1 nucleolar protein 53 [Geosmithia morbida]
MPVIKGPSSGDAPSSYKQPSRKGKKSWRKNVDVTEVQKGLEDLNEEIIRGGVIKEKEAADLFTLDIKGDIQTANKNKSAKKTLKSDEILAERSSVPAVDTRKRPAAHLTKITDGVVSTKRHKADWVSQKELGRLKRVADGQHDNTVEVTDATFDIWAEDAPTALEPKQDPKFDFLPKQAKPKAPKSMKQKPISLLASNKPIKAVKAPSSGHSYNPSFEAYEKRLSEEGAKAVEAERKRLEQEEAERVRAEALARSATEAEAADARAELSEWEEDSEWEGFQSDAEGTVAAKRPKRKTLQQRKSAERRKADERLAKHKEAMKQRRRQENRIAEIAEEVANKQQALQTLENKDSDADDDDDDDDDEKLRRRQLGKFKLPEKDLELILPDELQGSLRLLRPEGNLLKDRYRNMLLRGKVEARRHIPFKKQAKRKVTEKWTYKDFVL